MTIPSTTAAAAFERERAAHARALCHHHAAPLFAMASIILDDADTASEIVAATLAAACRPIRHPRAAGARARIELARSVYLRCVGQIATVERFDPRPRLGSGRSSPTEEPLSVHHRAVLALALFGGHDLRQAAITLQMSIPQVLRHMREAIRYSATARR